MFAFPTAFIIRDALSGDQLCPLNVTYLSHCCDVNFNFSNDMKRQCQYDTFMGKHHKAMQFNDLIDKEYSESSDSEEEAVIDVKQDYE